ncbi:MAG: hypothetical protein HYX27_28410 [Acidobacteria bacterium]|nr:hypothetical protein [Acidobacteriota bacterium]
MGQAAGQRPFVIVAILTPRTGSMESFREYETKAAVIIAGHGGVIERTVIEEPSAPEKPIREVHVVTFPDSEAFHSYRADPALAALADMRVASIAHTELLCGREGPDYMALSKDAGN